MIWHTQEIRTQNQPNEASVVLECSFNEPGGNLPVILIRLLICEAPESTIIYKRIWATNPSMMRYEEPDSEWILRKYNHKVQYWVKRISEKDFSEFLTS